MNKFTKVAAGVIMMAAVGSGIPAAQAATSASSSTQAAVSPKLIPTPPYGGGCTKHYHWGVVYYLWGVPHYGWIYSC